MKKSYLLLFLALVSISIFSCTRNAADNGFDQICQIYTNILTNPSNKSLSKDKKMGLIYKGIHETVTSKTALNAYETFMAANPKTRYSLLKEMAENELKHSWECKIIKTFNY
jgi:hypothetical protein